MRDPRTVDILCQIARKAAQGDATGTALFGGLALAYYPIFRTFYMVPRRGADHQERGNQVADFTFRGVDDMTPIGKHWQR
jgi:hypothetical protein